MRSTVRLGRRQAAPTDARISRRGQPSCRFFPHPTAGISPPPLRQRRGPVAIAPRSARAKRRPPGCQCATCCSARWAHRSPSPHNPTHRLTRSPPGSPVHGAVFFSFSPSEHSSTTLVSISECERRRRSTPRSEPSRRGLINERDDRRRHSWLRSSEESGRETSRTHTLCLSASKQRTKSCSFSRRLYHTDRLYPCVLWLEKGTFFGWDPIRGWVTEKGDRRACGLVSWKIKP